MWNQDFRDIVSYFSVSRQKMLQSYEPIYLESALSCEQEAKNLVQIGPGQLGPRQLGLGPGPKNIFKTNIHNRIALFLDSWKVDSYQFLKCVYNQHSCFYSDFCTKHLGCWSVGPEGGKAQFLKCVNNSTFLILWYLCLIH